MPPDKEETIIEETTIEDIPNEDIAAAMQADLDDLPPPDDPPADPPAETPPDDPPPDEPPAEPPPDEPPAEPAPDDTPPDEPPVEPPPAETPPDDPRPSDEFGVIDKDAPEKTQERFESLKTGFDKMSGERDTAIQERDTALDERNGWVETITGTGTNPEQFGMALNWLRKVNAGDPASLQDAYDIMSGELAAVGKLLGKAAPGVNPLDEHADLKDRVDRGVLDEKDALELAGARATQRLNTTRNEETTQANQLQGRVNQALEAVKTYGTQQHANDPKFLAKMPFLTPIIQSIAKAAPNNPETWLASIQEAYNNLPDVPMPAPVAVDPKPAVPNAMRPTNSGTPAAHLDKEPGSTMEAVKQSLARGW